MGETSVLIVVASAHRAAAFDACRWLIDTLKKTVPIWKKETFVDGAVWADGEPFPEEIVGGGDEAGRNEGCGSDLRGWVAAGAGLRVSRSAHEAQETQTEPSPVAPSAAADGDAEAGVRRSLRAQPAACACGTARVKAERGPG